MSPLTPSVRHASRPRRGLQQTKANKRPTHLSPRSQRTKRNFSIFIFICLPGPSPRTSLLGSFYNLHFGALRVPDNKNKTRCSQLRAHKSYSSQNTISRCQGKSRSGRPLAVYGAPLDLLRVFCPAFVFPHRLPAPPSPRSPHADTIFPRPSLDLWITRLKCPRRPA